MFIATNASQTGTGNVKPKSKDNSIKASVDLVTPSPITSPGLKTPTYVIKQGSKVTVFSFLFTSSTPSS